MCWAQTQSILLARQLGNLNIYFERTEKSISLFTFQQQQCRPSLRIGHIDTGETLPYGEVGEVLVSGPGVLKAYEGVAVENSHRDGIWLRTGDLGQLDEKTGKQ